MSEERTIILHYHLFKNAGTSVDDVLKRNFPGRWATREFPATNDNNTALVEQWIRETPEVLAYSSHTLMGPVPRVDGVRIISLMLLREPVARIKSAYRFERRQLSDTWGARLAKEHDFEGYVRARLARPGDRQCRNFQTYRLASLLPGAGSERDRAKAALAHLSVVGRVEAFDEAMARLAAKVTPWHPDFVPFKIRENVSQQEGATAMSAALKALLIENNTDDIELISALQRTA